VTNQKYRKLHGG